MRLSGAVKLLRKIQLPYAAISPRIRSNPMNSLFVARASRKIHLPLTAGKNVLDDEQVSSYPSSFTDRHGCLSAVLWTLSFDGRLWMPFSLDWLPSGRMY